MLAFQVIIQNWSNTRLFGGYSHFCHHRGCIARLLNNIGEAANGQSNRLSIDCRPVYKLGIDGIIRCCVIDHERLRILWEIHNGVAGGHCGGKDTTQKVLQIGLWWFTLFKDVKEYAKSCDIYQRTGWPSRRDELPLHLVVMLQSFDKWVMDFIRPINPVRYSRARYIITTTDYLTKWSEATPTQDCSTKTVARFIFKNIISRFGCPRRLTTDQSQHLMRNTIQALMQDFMVQHHTSSPYHLQANGTVKAFMKILEWGLTKVYVVNHYDWDERIPAVLWEYWMMTKKLTKHTPFNLVYGREAVMPA